jgi:hypothetical protein
MALLAYDAVTQSDVRTAKGDVETGRDGTLYYSNATEIRRLLPGEPAASGT